MEGVVRRRSTRGEAGEEPCAGRDCCCFSGESGDGVEAFVGGCGRRVGKIYSLPFYLPFSVFTNTITLYLTSIWTISIE